MKPRRIRSKLLMILGLAVSAVLAASVAAIWSMREIRQEVSNITEQELPKTASALTIARIGERLQRRGESFVAATTRRDRVAIQAQIDADLAVLRQETAYLSSRFPVEGRLETQITALSEQLVGELSRLRGLLDAETALVRAIQNQRTQLLDVQDQLRQTLGPSILAINAMLQRQSDAPDPLFEAALSSQKSLIATERLLSVAMTQALLVERASIASEVTLQAGHYERALRQLQSAVESLPLGLKDAVTVHLPVLANQTTSIGIFELQAQKQRVIDDIQGATSTTRDISAALKRAVDAMISADRASLRAVTDDLSDLFLWQTWQFIIGSLLILAFMTALSYLFIVRPIDVNLTAVTDAMTKLARGERDTEVPGVEREDEIGALARAFTVFKDMVFRMEFLDRELAQKSRLLVATFDNMNDGFTVHDASGRMVAWNPRFLSLYGLNEDVVSLGTPIDDVHAELAKKGLRVFSATHEETTLGEMATGRGELAKRFEILFPNGKVIELRSNPIPGGGFVSIHMDVTEQRATQEQLWHAQKMETVGQLSGGIAHDFNNILAVILGNLNIAKRESVGQPIVHDRVGKALSAAGRATAQVERLLSFSRQQELKPERVDLNQLIQGVTDLLDTSLGRSIILETRLEEGLPEVIVDPGQLENALMNLAINSRDAIADSGRIIISTRKTRGGEIEVEVTDNGEGIPQSALAQVFEPFFTTKPKGKGSGLGLSMIYGFVTQSGGSIDVRSRPRFGTSVFMRFPAGDGNVDRADSGLATTNGHGERILVVDDDVELLDLTAEQLRGLGYKVVCAVNGEQALSLLERDSDFQLLYSDVAMPGRWDGVSLAQRVTELHPHIAVVLTTAERGAVRDTPFICLQKPVAEYELAEVVQQVLASQSVSTSALKM